MIRTRRFSVRRIVGVAWVLIFGARAAAAQHYGLREVRDQGTYGFNLAVGTPQGDFARNVNVAGGLDGFAALNLGRGSPVALRFEGSYLIYGSDHTFIPQSFGSHLNTTYSIATFGIGPQITIGQGPMRLYGFGTIGISYISAYSSFGPDPYGYNSVTDFSDWTAAVQGGGGVLLRVGRHSPVFLDLGVRYLHNGFAHYVAPGDVQPQTNGDILVFTTRARPDLAVFHLGVTIAVR